MEYYNIYQKQIDGSGYFIKTLCGVSKEEVLSKFFIQDNISQEEKWLYYIIKKDDDEENKRILKENGCSSWENYFENMYPNKPIDI